MKRPRSASVRPDPLRDAGLVSTMPRRAIWSALSGSVAHPTADDVFVAIGGEGSGIARATVYRTLEAFVVAGLAQRVGHPGTAVRYDPRMTPHHHLVCERCGDMRDLEPRRLGSHQALQSLSRRLRSLDGFEVREVSVLLRGLCGACRSDT